MSFFHTGLVGLKSELQLFLELREMKNVVETVQAFLFGELTSAQSLMFIVLNQQVTICIICF